MNIHLFLKSLSKIEKRNLKNYFLHCEDDNNFPIFTCIFSAIYKEFGVSKKRLKYGTDRKNGIRNKALHAAAFLFDKYTDLNYNEIAIILNKDKTTVTRYFQKLKRIFNNKNKNKEFIRKVERAERYIKKNNQWKENLKRSGK